MRALLLTLAKGGGSVARGAAGLAHVPKDKRPLLRRFGVTIGALDVFMPALLKPAPRHLLHAIGADPRPVRSAMEPVIDGRGPLPAGYRRAGSQAIRVDMAEKLFRAAHDRRAGAGGRGFRPEPALATSMGLAPGNFITLLAEAGFRAADARALAPGAFGPPAPPGWSWRPPRTDQRPMSPVSQRPDGAFGALASLVR